MSSPDEPKKPSEATADPSGSSHPSDKPKPASKAKADLPGSSYPSDEPKPPSKAKADLPGSSHPSEFRALPLPTDPPAPSVVVARSDAPEMERSQRTLASGDDAILPAAYSESDLRDAVGVKPRPEPTPVVTPEPSDRFDDDDDGEPPAKKRSRRTIVVSAASLVVGLTIAGLVFLGRANASRYLLVCAADHVDAQQGRTFPPWGSRPLSGAEWKPIALPSNAECTPNETEDPAQLEEWYVAILIERASTALAPRNLLDSIPAKPVDGAPPTTIDTAAAELDQALLLTRTPGRHKQRIEIEKLLGDVDYWRAALKLRAASAAVLEAAKQFEAAAAKPPRHASDAAAWGSFVHRLADELHAGPTGVAATPAPLPTETKQPAPAGTALPVEPPTIDPAVTQPALDAGVAPGGVLL